MRLCKLEGCGRKHRAKGYCKLHYDRVSKRGVPGGNELEVKANSGRLNHPLYQTYLDMKRRCYNKNREDYKNYGGMGVEVCDRWLGVDGFDNFVDDMGAKPEGCSLDRINTNGNYHPENCRWANNHEQAANKRNSRKVVGVSQTKSGKWKAEFHFKGKYVLQKVYETKEQALISRKSAELKYLEANHG